MKLGMIIEKTRHYPPAIKTGIDAVLRRPMMPDRSKFVNLHSLNDPAKDVLHISQKDLSNGQTIWAWAIVAPCTMAAAIELSTDEKRVERVNVGHFGASGTVKGIETLVSDFVPERFRLQLAGMSQRSSTASIKECCDNIFGSLRGRRINNIHLRWEIAEQPVFYFYQDGREHTTSDLGLGIEMEKYRELGRQVFVGFHEQGAVMLSIAMIDLRPLWVDILSTDQDKLQFCPDQLDKP